MVHISAKYVKKHPFGEDYVELRANVQAMLRINESDIDDEGDVIQYAASHIYNMMLDEMNGFEIGDIETEHSRPNDILDVCRERASRDSEYSDLYDAVNRLKNILNDDFNYIDCELRKKLDDVYRRLSDYLDSSHFKDGVD